ncbi:MAG TPA: hypothetical protein VGK27_07315 [Candidatus Deferrimicrobiaceae bacterium]|jgi:hypothetical protein
MPRPIKDNQLPRLSRRYWEEEVFTPVSKLIRDSMPADIQTQALRILGHHEVGEALRYLMLENSHGSTDTRYFRRFDTDSGDGINLFGMIRECVEWATVPDPALTLKRAKETYSTTDDPRMHDLCFKMVCSVANGFLAPKRQGRQEDYRRNFLTLSLDFRLRRKFGVAPGVASFKDVIAFFLSATYGDDTDPEAVKRALTRLRKRAVVDIYKDSDGKLYRKLRLNPLK